MGTKTFLYLSVGIALLLSIGAVAAEVTGRTADGCTYRVINGQYLTSCPKRGAAEGAARPSSDNDARAAVAQDRVASVSSGPVTDYGAVPVRRNTGNSPALPPQQHEPSIGSSSQVSSIEREASTADLDDYDGRRARLKSKLIDQTYVGLQVGASNMKESNAGSSVGFGLHLGTNIDDTFGVELGWGYARQDLNLGLASRGSSTDPSQQPLGTGAPKATDSSLSSNLFTGEVQAHLTDPVKRLRPYVGAGLGWRSATLSETADAYSGLSGGSLHQNTFGGLLTGGTKLRMSKTFSLGFAFRYFLPLARQESRLEQPVASLNGQGQTQGSRLSASDDLLTGSSQYQVLGGVQYAF